MEEDFVNINGETYHVDDVSCCCRCEVQEVREYMLKTEMGYLCECCEGDLR